MISNRTGPQIFSPISRPKFSHTMTHLQIPLSPSHHCYKSLQELNQKSLKQLEDICELRKLIITEKSKRAQLEQKLSEMEEFIREYGLLNFKQNHKAAMKFLNGVPDIDQFRTQIDILNSKVKVHPKTLQQSHFDRICRVVDVKPIKIELLKTGFYYDGEDSIRKYSNPLNAYFLYLLSVGQYPQQIKEQFPDGIKIKLVDSTAVPDLSSESFKTIGSSSNSLLEPLPSPYPLGEGDGTLKVKLPSGNEQIVRIQSSTTVKEILDLLESSIGFAGYRLFSPFSNVPISDEKDMKELNIYPKGLLNAEHG